MSLSANPNHKQRDHRCSCSSDANNQSCLQSFQRQMTFCKFRSSPVRNLISTLRPSTTFGRGGYLPSLQSTAYSLPYWHPRNGARDIPTMFRVSKKLSEALKCSAASHQPCLTAICVDLSRQSSTQSTRLTGRALQQLERIEREHLDWRGIPTTSSTRK